VSLSDEKNALLAKLDKLKHEAAITERQLAVLENAARAMAAAEHGAPVKPAVEGTPNPGGRPIKSTHPLAKACVEVAGSIKAAATLLDVPPSTVRSWYAEDEEARTPPEDMQVRLSKAPWNIPLSTWTRRK
jgi:hypothetical protein